MPSGIGDLGECDRSRGAVHCATLDARVGGVRLKQVCADPLDFLDQFAARTRDGAPREHYGARGKGAEAEWRGCGITVLDRDAARIDGQFMRRDLRQRGLVALAVVLYPDVHDHRAVRKHPRIGGFVSGHDTRLALDPFDGAVTALFGVEGEADADHAAVAFPNLLTLADGREIDHVARGVEG
jgi:hypothetical protein